MNKRLMIVWLVASFLMIIGFSFLALRSQGEELMLQKDKLIGPTGEAIGTKKFHSIDYKHLAKVLIKEFDIHDGHWSVSLEFKSKGQEVILKDDNDKRVPAIFTFFPSIQLVKVDKATGMTVDAAEVNPKPKKE